MAKIGNWEWFDFEELGSTNDKAMELSANPPSCCFVITAQRQTAGRGRRGRVWQSENGNLFMSMGMPFALEKLGHLVFLISLSVLSAVKKLAPDILVQVKWPNDVLINNKKISGILLEKGEKNYIIAGIGINITASPVLQQNLIYRSASLRDFGLSVDRYDFLTIFLEEFDGYLHLWKEQGFAPVRNLWLQNVKGLGEEILVNGEKNSLKGVFRGIDEDGLLLMEKDGKIIKVFAGDVVYVQEDEEIK